MAAFHEAATVFKVTGPYRRIWSGTNLSAVRATVFLQGKDKGIKYGQLGDTAFVYSGGWGYGGEALDAGFMHKPVSDSWSLFIKYQGKPEYTGSTPNIRLKPNQWVTFTFWIPEDGTIRLEAAGQAVDVNTNLPLGVNRLPFHFRMQMDFQRTETMSF